MKLKIFISFFILILITTFSLLPVSAETASESPTTYRYYFYNNLNGEPVFDSVYLHVCNTSLSYPMLQHPDYENVYYYDLTSSNVCLFIANGSDTPTLYSTSIRFKNNTIFIPDEIFILDGKNRLRLTQSNLDTFLSTLPSPIEYHFSKSISSLSNNIFQFLVILIPSCILIFAVIIGIKSSLRFIRGLIAK